MQVGIKHGQDDNGKWVCGLRTLLKRSPCIVYSFGSNGKTSFEQDILRATKCVHFACAGCSEPAPALVLLSTRCCDTPAHQATTAVARGNELVVRARCL